MATAVAGVLLASCDSPGGPIAIDNVWSPPAPPGASVAAVYMRIRAREADVLLSAATPIAERAEMHATFSDGNMMRMRPIEQLVLAAGETVQFEPGGRHFMLIDVRAPQASGASFPLTLHFRNAGEIVTQVAVQAGGQ